MVDLAGLNPLAGAKIGSFSIFATGFLILFIVVGIMGLIGVLIFMNVIKKQYFLKIRCFRLVGNVPTEIAFLEQEKCRWAWQEINFGVLLQILL